jgi:hypothetical protein
MAAREWVARRQAFVVRLYRVLGERRVDVLRNRLARECPDKPELRHAQLLAAVAGAAELLAAYRGWAGRLPANSA